MSIIRSVALILFFFSVVFFAYSPSEMIFNSPDENANAVFALEFADDSMFAIPSSFDQAWNVLVHPRSTLVVSDRIVPVSFTGLSVVAGLVASVFGCWSIMLVTPILAILAIIAWRQSIYQIFNNGRLADLAALFLMIHPAFWHYTGRTMMHNVGFVALLVIAFYFFVNQPLRSYWKNSWYLDEILAGIGVGLALAFRSSEVIWVVAIIAALLIWRRASIGWQRILVFVVSIAIMLLPFLALNNALYGAPWLTGYTVESVSPFSEGGIGVAAIDQTEESLPGILGILFPFGIHEMNMLRNVLDYGFFLYPWMSGLSILGIIFVFKRKEWRLWLIVTIGLSIWMALVYGSWKFSDNPDASILTVGNSYARYWLPLFVLASIFAAAAVDRVTTWIEKRKLPFASGVPWAIAVITILFSTRLVVWGADGFIQTNQNIESFIEKKDIVLEHTSEDSIIIVDMADKYLFPDRSVVTPLRDDVVYALIPEMIEATDLLYFGITLPNEDIQYLENVIFENVDITVEEVITVEDETLYRFIKH